MKPFRFISAALSLAVLFVISASAQTAAPQQPAARPAAQGGNTVVVIVSEAFADPQNGIRRLANAFSTLEREFAPRREELRTMQQRLETMAQNIQRQQSAQQVVDQAALSRQRAEAEQLQRDITRRTEDAQAAYQRRVEELLGPIYTDIQRVLQEYAQSRGYGVVLDLSRFEGGVMLINDGMNITGEFITEYNRRNPAPAAAAAAPAATPAANRPASNPATPANRRP